MRRPRRRRGLRPHGLPVRDDRKTFLRQFKLNAYKVWPGFARIQNVFVQNGLFSTETAQSHYVRWRAIMLGGTKKKTAAFKGDEEGQRLGRTPRNHRSKTAETPQDPHTRVRQGPRLRNRDGKNSVGRVCGIMGRAEVAKPAHDVFCSGCVPKWCFATSHRVTAG
jgi:hypothetical protein